MAMIESQATYDIAHFVAWVFHKFSPRDHLMVGDEPWIGLKGATGKEWFAPHILYSNDFSSRHRKKVVYFQSAKFRSSNPLPHGIWIIFMALGVLIIGNTLFLP
mmetsp:Transcript_3152/g.3913  ORF Transcript_3152/g.3913 Transcript_3152/m.3913 type:complete len:104 (+) Transcript_3152:78-389(+)